MMSDNDVSADGDENTLLRKLTSQDLQTLRTAFQEKTNVSHDCGHLTKIEFADLMQLHLGIGEASEYNELFDLVDVTRDGFITWEMFSNHLILQYYEQDDRTKHTKIPSWFSSKPVATPHKSFICKTLLVHSNPTRYYTVGRDGLLCVFDTNFQLRHSYQILTNPDEIRAKDLWVTDACYLSNVNKIAFSTTSREILIYEIHSNKKAFVLSYRLHGFKNIPMCLDYWVNTNNTSQSVLSTGDTGGDMHAFFFSITNNHSLFETSNDNMLQSENGQKICQHIHLNELSKSCNKNVHYLSHRDHSSWIRQVCYSPSLDCFMTCSTSPKEALIIAWVGKGRRSFRLAKFNIGLGLSSFDYHEKLNMIATGGIDHLICLWNPYVTAKPNGVLRGHVQTIINVKFVKERNLLLSVSKDKIFRVWDVQLQMCLQRLTGLFSLNKSSVDFSFHMNFDDYSLTLLAAINSNLYSMRMKNEQQDKVLSHEASITNLVFNDNFNQLITVCEASTITIWYLNTGQKIKSINHAHNGNEITALNLDHSMTHILTGATDGLIKVWDMNGNCHNVLICADNEPCEITQILWLKRSIYAVGWSKNICVFDVNDMKSYYVQPTSWKGKQKHYDDVFSLQSVDPKYLLSASYDGDVVLWNINSHNPIRKIFTADEKPNAKSLKLPPIVTKGARNSIPNLDSKRNLSVPTNSLRRSSMPDTKSRPSSGDSCSRKVAVTISSLCLLKFRNPADENSANIFVTHTDGTLSFWNTQTCKRIDTYHAFNFNGSIVSCVNSDESVAGLGSETGVVKLINLHELCGVTEENSNLLDKNGVALFTIFHHEDVITAIKIIDKLNVHFVVTSSADCTVALHCNEHFVGVFGGDKHWNLNDFVETMKTESKVMTNENDSMVSHDRNEEENEETPKEETQLLSNENTIEVKIDEPVELSDAMFENLILSDTWQNTSLGKTYQTKGSKKRKTPRVSTKLIQDNCNLFQTSYLRLPTNKMSEISPIEKPDFVLHPERYFLKKGSNLSDIVNNQNYMDNETVDLKFVHSEKNFFPKHILDMEMKRRAVTNITTYGNHRSKVSFKPAGSSKVSDILSARKTR